MTKFLPPFAIVGRGGPSWAGYGRCGTKSLPTTFSLSFSNTLIGSELLPVPYMLPFTLITRFLYRGRHPQKDMIRRHSAARVCIRLLVLHRLRTRRTIIP